MNAINASTAGTMAPLSGAAGEAMIVTKLNQIFYDVEADQYEERHPEVLEGQADWWITRGESLVAGLRSGWPPGARLLILDVGCGTGLVSSLLAPHLAAEDLIVGVDQSAGMLKRAASKLAGRQAPLCRFARGDAARLQFPDHRFHMVTVNSFLHHVYDYGSVLTEADRVLKPGGHLIIANEPNKEFFQSAFIRLAASAWKLVGFGMRIPKDLCDQINARLRESQLPSELGSADILRLVEYHSPVEQGTIRIDKNKGFALHDLLARELKGYRLIEHNEHSTFYRRPRLEQNPWLQRAAKAAATLLNGKGNLFTAVLRKDAARI